MFNVQRYDGPIDTIELTDDTAKSSVVLAPSRGGLATRFRVGLREVFYFDESTFFDISQNVRGGNPVLFPAPGKLDADAWSREGLHGKMTQHGFARHMPWTLVSTSQTDGASATLRLTSTDATLEVYPFPFVLECTYLLKGTKLRIESRITNTGPEPMPCGLGFHPYFLVPQSEKPGARVETAATRAFDNVAKKIVQFPRIQLALPELDLHFINHGSSRSAITWADDRVTIEASKEFGHLVVWSIANKDYVCLEPWTSPANALNSGEDLLTIAPNETRALWVSYGAEMKEIKAPRPHHAEGY